jgi:hypothetical protein
VSCRLGLYEQQADACRRILPELREPGPRSLRTQQWFAATAACEFLLELRRDIDAEISQQLPVWERQRDELLERYYCEARRHMTWVRDYRDLARRLYGPETTRTWIPVEQIDHDCNLYCFLRPSECPPGEIPPNPFSGPLRCIGDRVIGGG